MDVGLSAAYVAIFVGKVIFILRAFSHMGVQQATKHVPILWALTLLIEETLCSSVSEPESGPKIGLLERFKGSRGGSCPMGLAGFTSLLQALQPLGSQHHSSSAQLLR